MTSAPEEMTSSVTMAGEISPLRSAPSRPLCGSWKPSSQEQNCDRSKLFESLTVKASTASLRPPCCSDRCFARMRRHQGQTAFRCRTKTAPDCCYDGRTPAHGRTGTSDKGLLWFSASNKAVSRHGAVLAFSSFSETA